MEKTKMKKAIKLVSTALLLTMLLCVTACGKDETEETAPVTHASAEELVGRWKGTGKEISTLTLGAKGSYSDVAEGVASITGTYTVDSIAGTLTVNEKEYGMVFTYSYDLSGDNLTLQLEGGNPRTFVKQ